MHLHITPAYRPLPRPCPAHEPHSSPADPADKARAVVGGRRLLGQLPPAGASGWVGGWAGGWVGGWAVKQLAVGPSCRSTQP